MLLLTKSLQPLLKEGGSHFASAVVASVRPLPRDVSISWSLWVTNLQEALLELMHERLLVLEWYILCAARLILEQTRMWSVLKSALGVL